MVAITKLNADQQAAAEKLTAFFKIKTEKEYCLSGAAGTGKTFTISNLEFGKYFSRVIFSAIANKAIGVIRGNMSEQESSFFEYITVTSLLNRRLITDKYGKKRFVEFKRKEDEVLFDETVLLIIDECSMLSEVDMEAFTRLHPHCKKLFLGDDSQIPAIEKGKNPNWNIFDYFDQNGNISYLTKNMRQGQDNPLLVLASKNRTPLASRHQSLLFDLESNNIQCNELGGVIEYNKVNYLQLHINKAVDTIICFTNKTKNEINKYCHKFFYGDLPYGIEERIIFEERSYEAHLTGDTNKLKKIYNSQIAVVLGVEVKTKIFEKQVHFYRAYKDDMFAQEFTSLEQCKQAEKVKEFSKPILYYELCVSLQNFDGTYNPDETYQVCVIHPESQKDFDSFCRKMFTYTDGFEGKDNYDKEFKMHSSFERNNQYLSLTDYFAQIDYNYAITCHKAQGSTMRSVGVWMDDLWGPTRRMFYTAITRAKQFTYLLK